MFYPPAEETAWRLPDEDSGTQIFLLMNTSQFLVHTVRLWRLFSPTRTEFLLPNVSRWCSVTDWLEAAANMPPVCRTAETLSRGKLRPGAAARSYTSCGGPSLIFKSKNCQVDSYNFRDKVLPSASDREQPFYEMELLPVSKRAAHDQQNKPSTESWDKSSLHLFLYLVFTPRHSRIAQTKRFKIIFGIYCLHVDFY